MIGRARDDHFARDVPLNLTHRISDCGKIVKKRGHMQEHARVHTQEKCVGCPQCGGMFANKTKFSDHIVRQQSEAVQIFHCQVRAAKVRKTVRPSPPPFVCVAFCLFTLFDAPFKDCRLVLTCREKKSLCPFQYCSKKFGLERLLRDHMRQHVNHYKCPLCDMTCAFPANLRHHIQFKHSEYRPHCCPRCPYMAKTQYDLTKHLNNHELEESYECNVEGCDFSSVRCVGS